MQVFGGQGGYFHSGYGGGCNGHNGHSGWGHEHGRGNHRGYRLPNNGPIFNEIDCTDVTHSFNDYKWKTIGYHGWEYLLHCQYKKYNETAGSLTNCQVDQVSSVPIVRETNQKNVFHEDSDANPQSSDWW